ncbi:MAG: UDP-N-acetylglucosamine 1-carboxyvinyltransferase, partial [Monoglobaceae bacterium]
MSAYKITPGTKISGEVRISGSKNASLPIIAASLLSGGQTVLHNIPKLSDTENMCELITSAGASVKRENENDLIISPGSFAPKSSHMDLASKLRASFLIIGPMLARYGRAKIPLPGGCRIGARPIDLHLKGFTAMGAKIRQGHGYVELKCDRL